MRIAILVPDNRDEWRRYTDPDPYFGPAPSALLQGLANVSDCEVHIVCCTQRPLRSPDKTAKNTHYHSLVVGKWGWLRGGYVGCVRAIRAKLQAIKPDVVHGQGTERYCALAAVYSGFPCVLTIHGNMRQIAKASRARPFSFLWLTALLERLALPRAGGIVCISSHTQRQVGSLARQTWMIPNAVDPRFFEVENKPELPAQLLCVATISVIKNQIALIRALDALAAQRAFQLIFCGGAPAEDAYVREFFGLLEQRPWCRYAGVLDREGLFQALGRATGLVLPSIEDNCPMAVLEAMAAGVPVAAANVGGLPDLIQNGADGLLFDPRDAVSMRTAVATLLEGREKPSSLAAAAKAKAMSCFHPDRIAQRHLDVYRQITGKSFEASDRQ